MRSDNRSEMLEQNVKALITNKINTVISSRDFYEKIKSNKDFVKKVLSTEKYNWPNMEIYKRLNIVLSLSKMHCFSLSWCLNYRNPKWLHAQ